VALAYLFLICEILQQLLPHHRHVLRRVYRHSHLLTSDAGNPDRDVLSGGYFYNDGLVATIRHI
jgi:hypothetical protein